MQRTPSPIRVFITDDHALVRDGLKHLFALVPDIEVVGEAENGAQLLERLDRHEIDLLLLDMNMPGLSGEALIAHVHALRPSLPILVLSTHDELRIVEAALHAGAHGYLNKDRDPEMLVAAVRRVAAGGRFIDPGLAALIAPRLVRPEGPTRHDADRGSFD